MSLALACLVAWALLIGAVLWFFRAAARVSEGSDEHERNSV